MRVFRLSMYSCSACRRASISASSAEDSLIWFSGECMKKKGLTKAWTGVSLKYLGAQMGVSPLPGRLPPVLHPGSLWLAAGRDPWGKVGGHQ